MGRVRRTHRDEVMLTACQVKRVLRKPNTAAYIAYVRAAREPVGDEPIGGEVPSQRPPPRPPDGESNDKPLMADSVIQAFCLNLPGVLYPYLISRRQSVMLLLAIPSH